ncbi:MAG TPA: general secretion pathway protein GspB [Luteimonas sp.]|nr:general secretion pathway protein GspB [Luteimonas sp.]
MSLILEALRKSEAERRRGAIPELHGEMPTSPVLARSTVPGWVLWALAAAALVVALLWVAHAWWPRSAMMDAPVAATRPAIAPRRVSPLLSPVTRLSPPPVTAAAHAPAVAAPPPATKTPVPQPAPLVLTPPPAYVPPPPKAAPILHDDTIALSDLSADERKALPPLKLSMHLWNDDPARRFVILDGNRLKEGDRVGNAVISAITTDGVVLDWNGRRIRLSIR